MNVRPGIATLLTKFARAAGGFCGRLFRADAGGAAMVAAFALPPLLVVAMGAVQLNVLVSDRQKTQDVADAAALWGARQLTIAPTGVEQRAVAYADAQLTGVKSNAAIDVKATVTGKTTIKLIIETSRPSFFMNLVPAGGFHTHVEAVAEGLNQSPLCVLALGSSGGDDVTMSNSAKLQAPACLIHSNQSVTAAGSALIQGQTVEAVNSASGPISPTASTGAPTIPDPFTALPIDTSGCLLGGILPLPVLAGTLTLPAGVHLFNYSVLNGATLALQPGDHVFCGSISLQNSSNLTGDDVALIFAANSTLDFKAGGNISLTGRKSGAHAGFVMIQSRQGSGNFDLNSDPISNITGTIYIPSASLRVDGSKTAGASSAWTVVAAKGFQGINGANLLISANYTGSTVPVPGGVGNTVGTTHLTK